MAILVAVALCVGFIVLWILMLHALEQTTDAINNLNDSLYELFPPERKGP